MPGNGLIPISPTSIVFAGTSASVANNSRISFSAITSLSLNGVFTASYDNYIIFCRGSSSGQYPYTHFRLRSAGVDNVTASSYVTQYIRSLSSTVSGARTTSDKTSHAGIAQSTSGFALSIFAPALAQPTVFRDVVGVSYNTSTVPDLYDAASSHNQSTAYDGITFFPDGGTISGVMTVYGLNQ